FMPAGLSADNDWPLVSGPSDPRVAIGLLFVAAIAIATWWSSRRDATKPIAYGLAWFVITLLPTSLTPLAEVANDHRMFFPFVGLSLAVAGGGGPLLQTIVRSPSSRVAIAGALMAVVLLAETAGVHARNQVWRSEESL